MPHLLCQLQRLFETEVKICHLIKNLPPFQFLHVGIREAG